MENAQLVQKLKKDIRVHYKVRRRTFVEGNYSMLNDDYYISHYFPKVETIINKYSE
jgi:hypothetical protein